MASSSGCTKQVGELEVANAGRGLGESSLVSEYLSGESEHGPSSCELFLTAQCESIVAGGEEGLGECGEGGIMEEIERSKAHWSLLVDPMESGEVGEGVVAEVDNVEIFKALQEHPNWGEFFRTFGHDVGGRYGSMGQLVVGEKFAEGGQAELYHAQVKWDKVKTNEGDLMREVEWVVKVFKEGTFLRHIYKQLPHGYLQFKVEEWTNLISATPTHYPRYRCEVLSGILLEDGRFAFLMKKEHCDLRSLIDQSMKIRTSEDCGPFSHDDAEVLMYQVALGVKWLHDHDIVHRDLKASNVLVHKFQSGWPKWLCFIADYECSVGVVGTGFFRAPEILQACKDRKLNVSQEMFSKAADAYSYGMTCFEILTGKLPFEGHASYDFDRVLHGPQLMVPEYVNEWTRFLLSRCWQRNPLVRPSMEEIVNSFLARSPRIRAWEARCVERYKKLNQQS